MATPAGTATATRQTTTPGSDAREAVAAINQVLSHFIIDQSNLAAGADVALTAFFRLPAAAYIESCYAIYQANSAGIDGSNTAAFVLRNITQSVDIGTLTLTGNVTASTAGLFTMTSANQDGAAGDIIGFQLTQGATADLSALTVQVNLRYHNKIGDAARTVITA